MSEGVTLLIMTGVEGVSDPEAMLNRSLEANTLDLLKKTGSIPAVERQLLITNSPSLLSQDFTDYPGLEVINSGDEFHFGNELFSKIDEYDVKNLFYLGGGSGPLFREEDLAGIVNFIQEKDNVSLANNFYSTDMIGFTPATSLLELDPPEKDNELGWLTREAELKPFEMKRCAKTELDLDTPADLLPIKLSGLPPGELSEHVSGLSWGGARIREILPQFTDQESRLVIAGRVGAATWSKLEKSAACHVDVLSEGRGSYGRATGGNRSYLTGKLFEEYGPEGFLQVLLDKGTGLFLDTRVLFDFLGEWPSRKDRFASDLLQPEGVATGYLNKLTRAAAAAEKPVVLGGHSTISGALYLLADSAWNLVEPKSVNIRPKTFTL